MLAKIAIMDQTSITLSSKALDAYALRGRAISDNIANTSTPDYQAIEVSFEENVRKYLDKDIPEGFRSNSKHLYSGRPELDNIRPFAYRNTTQRNPGELNNVDIDMEMSGMAENSLMFNYGVKFIRERMEAISSAIKSNGQ